jgi:hypothetical protein
LQYVSTNSENCDSNGSRQHHPTGSRAAGKRNDGIISEPAIILSDGLRVVNNQNGNLPQKNGKTDAQPICQS